MSAPAGAANKELDIKEAVNQRIVEPKPCRRKGSESKSVCAHLSNGTILYPVEKGGGISIWIPDLDPQLKFRLLNITSGTEDTNDNGTLRQATITNIVRSNDGVQLWLKAAANKGGGTHVFVAPAWRLVPEKAPPGGPSFPQSVIVI